MSEEIKTPRKSRLRFWVWLLVWSLVLAAVEQSFWAEDRSYWDFERGAAVNGMRLVTVYFCLTAVNVLLSYLAIRIWKKRPRSRRAWFWLGGSSVTLGILWILNLCRCDVIGADDFTGTYLSWQLLIWSVIFLAGMLVLFSLRHFFRWLVSWRIIKRCLWAAGLLTVLIAAFYAVENWRGKRAWENYRREWDARGEKFHFTAYMPPLVPDDQNFAMAPIVVSSYAGLLDGKRHDDADDNRDITNRLRMVRERSDYNFFTNMTGAWQTQKPTELKVWQEHYRATAITNVWNSGDGTNQTEIKPLGPNEFPVASEPQSPAADVLLALSKYDTAIAELRQAGERPFSRFPLAYQMENLTELLLPHLASIKSCAQVLQLRASAELQLGQTDQALADLRLIWRLADSIRSEPVMISHMVRVILANIAIQAVWEGLAERRWSERQLKEIIQELQKLNFVSDFAFCLRAERAFSLGYIEYLRKHPGQDSGVLLWAFRPMIPEGFGKFVDQFPYMTRCLDWPEDAEGEIHPGDLIDRALSHLPPSGWYEQNKLYLAKTYKEHLIPIGNPEKHLISRQTTAGADDFIDAQRALTNAKPQNLLAGMLLAAIPRTADKFGSAQSAVDLATLACALERYHLTHGDYPETLTALAPQFIEKIPPDVINGEPLHYHRTDEGRFLLYSVGWNGKDDGGVVGLRENGRLNLQIGDVVWRYPVRN